MKTKNTTPVNVEKDFNTDNTDPHAEILGDIVIELYVELGRVKLKISDLLAISNGTIIQLEQKFDEPLTIYANDKAIAKGQIISANGKFNIRILTLFGDSQQDAILRY